ncbi:FkbM family methyltransferase [Trichlorobacter lovleyi]|uniref:FkbM family methyltransferase n=1 Tax=Trichlorobacter lovleyi TaxID=313985 RepID=UPI0023EFCE64|nr:FkbM family methyltransferase [Trichlorobacter lovleyi]
MHIIDTILRREEFVESPPILVDIGASGAIHQKWRRIAPYAICIAFDADDREMGFAVHESKGYRKLYVFNRIVADQPTALAPFHLTKSPYCSSLLRPDQDSLAEWAFGGLFDVDRVADLEVVTLKSVLDDLGISKVDWFKTDSQGTDLRLFRSLGDDIVKRIILAEFEPGIMNAYENEDKLSSLMVFMGDRPFWMSGLVIKGSQRIRRQTFEALFSPFRRRLLGQLMKTAPGWGEVTYINAFSDSADYLDKRDYLLGWIIAVIERHLGFALDIALRGANRFSDPVFEEMRKHTLRCIRWEYRKIPLYLMRRFVAALTGIAGAAG